MEKPTLSEHQAKLLDLLEEQLCLWDKKIYDGIEFDAELYFRKVHRAVDAVYREIEGIPQMTKTGRPLGHFRAKTSTADVVKLMNENERLRKALCQAKKVQHSGRFRKKLENG